jgi:hypothetical protein
MRRFVALVLGAVAVTAVLAAPAVAASAGSSSPQPMTGCCKH